MSTIFKSYVSFFIMLVFLTGATGLIAACLNARAADDFMTGVITEISNTNFAVPVISACKTKAAENGYELNIDTYDTNGDLHADSAVARLIYHYTISMFGVDNEHVIRAVIR